MFTTRQDGLDPYRQIKRRFSEKEYAYQDGAGYKLELHEISLGDVGLKWGSYATATPNRCIDLYRSNYFF